MFFVDREDFQHTPEMRDVLKVLSEKNFSTWEESFKNKNTPEPSGKWRNNTVLLSNLALLFWHNCGYCGSKLFDNNGQVDHFLPKPTKKKDNLADWYGRVYDWDNYIWSCPKCNEQKGDKENILNPCSEDDTDLIIFDPSTGNFKGNGSNDTRIINTLAIKQINMVEIARLRKQYWNDIIIYLDEIDEIFKSNIDLDQENEEIHEILNDIRSLIHIHLENSITFKEFALVKFNSIDVNISNYDFPKWIEDEIRRYFYIPGKRNQ